MANAAVWLKVLDQVCAVQGGWSAEYQFCRSRKWRFDFAAASERIAIEVEGGVFRGGRHTRGAGYVRDLAKYNAAVVRGWQLLRYTPDQMAAGAFWQDVRDVIARSASDGRSASGDVTHGA